MKLNIKTLLLPIGLMICAGASAQNTRTGYFLDEYTFRYQMNPAEGNDRGFVGMPVLSNMNIAMNGNIHVTNLLYNINGKTSLFTNPGVSAAEVMSGIKNSNRLGADLHLNLISAGWKAWGGYNTVTIGARADVGVKIPKGIFALAKEGVSNTTYDLSGLAARANAYAEIALNHSRNITNEWRVGAALKFLVGVGNVNANIESAKVTLGHDNWTVQSNGTIDASVKGFNYSTEVNDRTGHRYVSGVNMDDFSAPNGFGIGFDLGATYSPSFLPDWKFSLALLDLGFISWSNNMQASTNGTKNFETDAYTFSPDDDAENSFSKEWDRLRDGISAIYELDDNGDKGGRTTSLATTLNIGAEYTFPFYRQLTFGLMNTTRMAGDFTWTDFRLSANVAPCKYVSAAISGSAGTFGVGFGWLLNVHVTGFNLFLGMDRTLGKLAKQGVPLNSNASVNFGLDFLF